VVTESGMTGRAISPGIRFAQSKFRPPALPGTVLTRSVLHDRLAAGAGQRLTVVVGSAGAGKSVLLSSWAAARPAGLTSWLSCDEADANPVRFWTGFVEAPRGTEPWFGAEAADLLALDDAMSADVTASLANDAAKLPAGSALVVDDFQYATSAAARHMTDLIERWPARTAQLVLASRSDPPLRLHRLRVADELCELRDRDLVFSLDESRNLLANFGVDVAAGDLAVLHERSEGWAAALQMAALSLRGARDPARAARALDVRSHAIAEYFISEVLDQQPPEIAGFMLETSILGELTAEACRAVTGRQDAAALLRTIDAAHLFLVAWMRSGPASGATTWPASCCAPSCEPGTGPGSRCSSGGQRSISSPPGMPGGRPATSWPRGRPTTRWPCCRTGWWPTTCATRRWPRRWICAWWTRRCWPMRRTGCWGWPLS
jgi:LuxR family transcriptional regulator, maltose regulon positive regulatory protein